jgi:hypothetical protein
MVNPRFIPTVYDVGITTLLDPRQAQIYTENGKLAKSVEDTLHTFKGMLGGLQEVLYETDWLPVEDADIDVSRILDEKFFSRYTGNLRRCVDLVQWVRIIYSNARILFRALSTLGVSDPLGSLATTLVVQRDELDTLASFCKKAKLPGLSKEVFQEMLSLTEKIQKITLPRSIDRKTYRVNWYRACLPAVLSYLKFGVEWGNVPADFGELALPPIIQSEP